jgi:uncharacterized protein (DUF362 family)
MNKDVVGIAFGNGASRNVKNALALVPLETVRGKSVLIKPNIGRAAHAGQGINTDPQAVAGAIEAMREAGASRIAVGESPIVGVDTMQAFGRSGVVEIAREYGVDLIDLNEKKYVRKEIPSYRILSETKVCTSAYEFDLILSLPVAKCHMHTGVTLGIKNMKGCLWGHEKVRYHQLEYEEGRTFPEKTLDSAISDLAMILLPHIVVIDGYIGMEGLGPSGGEPIRSDFAVASLNPLGADVFGCIMMGIDPNEVPHLKLVSERRNIPISPDAYDVRVADALDYTAGIVAYNRPPKNVSLKYPNVVVYDCDSCSACQSTVMLFLRRFKDDMSQYFLNDGKFHIGIGRSLPADVKEGTILIGNCTKNVKDRGLFVPGCPPVPTRIYKAITGIEPEENEPEIK